MIYILIQSRNTATHLFPEIVGPPQVKFFLERIHAVPIDCSLEFSEGYCGHSCISTTHNACVIESCGMKQLQIRCPRHTICDIAARTLVADVYSVAYINSAPNRCHQPFLEERPFRAMVFEIVGIFGQINNPAEKLHHSVC
jgi:hypothetical protein